LPAKAITPPLKVVINGAAEEAMSPLLNTLMGWLVAPAGTVTVKLVVVPAVTVAWVAPKNTMLFPKVASKPVPVMVTVVNLDPLVGVKEAMVGGTGSGGGSGGSGKSVPAPPCGGSSKFVPAPTSENIRRITKQMPNERKWNERLKLSSRRDEKVCITGIIYSFTLDSKTRHEYGIQIRQ
jgi:hypothetical protein